MKKTAYLFVTVKSFLSKIPSVFSGNSPTSVLYTLLALRKQDSAGASAPTAKPEDQHNENSPELCSAAPVPEPFVY